MRYAFALLLCLIHADDPKPFDPVGTWEGSLDVGVMKLRLAFKITKNDDGTLKGSMDSIDQGAKNIPLGTVKFEEGELTFDMPMGKASFAGKPASNGQSVSGTWKQATKEYPLELKRVEKPTEIRRPQNPTKPYPYREEEVTIKNPTAKDVK